VLLKKQPRACADVGNGCIVLRRFICPIGF
jgi:hypothetical protein